MDGGERIETPKRRSMPRWLAAAFSPEAPVFRPFERLIDPFAEAAQPAPPRDFVAFLRWGLADVRPHLWALALLSLAVGATEAGVSHCLA